ncbi:MAG TPA: sulfite exporter TauE/SafE family protein, partial [Actinoplanes sp.]
VRHIPPRVLGSAVGGIIILTNVRTLLRSDWIDAPDGVRYTVYAVIYVIWAGSLLYSIRQYRANREEEQRIIAEAEAAAAAGGRPDETVPAG